MLLCYIHAIRPGLSGTVPEIDLSSRRPGKHENVPEIVNYIKNMHFCMRVLKKYTNMCHGV